MSNDHNHECIQGVSKIDFDRGMSSRIYFREGKNNMGGGKNPA